LKNKEEEAKVKKMVALLQAKIDKR